MTSTATEQRTIITQALRKIDDLTTRLEIAEHGDTEPIAIVGMGCRFPGGADDPRRYWKFLQEGGNGVVRVPKSRWDADVYYSSDHTVPGTICTRDGGFLTSWQPDEFDADFFGISPREAAAMDPQQRLLLEVSWEALEDAGINPQRIRNSQTSVFVGLTTNDYSMTFHGKLPQEEIDPHVPFGNASNFAAGRLAYFLGLHGPAVVIDTACSSSLVAVHLACQSLRRHESDSALAAGVNLILSPENSIACSRWGMLSVDGRCKAFDADANGYVRSEGCGVVVLKRLSDALREGDPVLAVVRGSAVNQDGPSSGQTVPNGPAQQTLLRQALAASRLQPSDIDYIEAHGTGTALGDPIELGALSAVFEDRGGSAPLILGSVKTNLGHSESAAGVAGLIKTVLSLQHGEIPEHLNFSRLTPNACEGAARFTVAAQRTPWPTVERPRRAGVSSFGVSGTNAHLVLEQAPQPKHVEQQLEPAVSMLVVSGKSPQRIAASAAVLAEWMTGDGVEVSPHSVAHTLNHHRARYPLFGAVIAEDRDQTIAGLRALAAGHPAPGVVAPHTGICRAGTVFVYSGQGSQWAGMGRRLLIDEPAFAAAVNDIEPDFVDQNGFSLRQVLVSGESVIGIERVQPVLVAVQLALTALWRSYDVTPDAVIGHSMGEVTAAVVAGALTPAEGLRVVATRSRLLSRLAGQGAMALLELDAAATEELIGHYPHCTVAVYASPRQTVIAGPPDEVSAAVKNVASRDLLARNIEVDVASHHATVDPILMELRQALSDLRPAAPNIPVISTTGSAGTFDAEHWVANLRNPVQFSQAVAVAGAEHATFIEISPHPVLGYAVSDTLRDTHHHSLGTLFRDTHDALTFHTNRAAAHTMRAPDTPHPSGPHTWIPNTPWQHTRHWIATPDDSLRREPSAKPHDSVPQDVDGVPGDWFYDMQWPEMPVSSRPELSSDEPWLVCEDADERHGVGAALRRVLPAPVTVRTTAAIENDDVWLRDVVSGVRNVLYAPDVSTDRMDVPSAYRLFNRLRRLATAITESDQPAKLFVVTRNAQPVRDGDPANPVHAVLWGLCRTLALEHSEIWGGVIDVDDAVVPAVTAHFLVAELNASGGEDQVVYRSGVRHVPRLRARDMTANLVGLESITDDRSQLVIGATGGIGPRLIRQLAQSGAGTIVAVSRHAGGQLTELAASLAAAGTRLVEVGADCADEAAMTELFDRFGTDLPPLDGIYLAALAGRPALLSEMTDDDVDQMFRPKLDAVALLHTLSLQTLTSPTPVRRFVMFSSITGILGSRWLGHYTASGAYLDAFAYWRRVSGLPATVIDWGLWQTSGEHPETTDVGLQPMDGEVAIRALSAVTSPSAPARSIVVAADWQRLAAAYRMRGKLRVIDDLLLTQASDHATVDEGTRPRFGTLLGALADNDNAWGAQRWQALLVPDAKPYPGEHRIRGVEMVPASVLLQTLAATAAQCSASILADIRFEYPVVLGPPKLIEIDVDGGWLTVSSRPADAGDGHRATRHISARIATRHDAVDTSAGSELPAPAADFAAAADVQRAWGIEGQPFDWTVDAWQPVAAGFDAEVSLPQASTVALLDAAVHIARLVDSANPALLFPAEVDSARFAAELTTPGGCVRVRQRPDEDGDLVVDVVATTLDGQACFDILGLRYVDADIAAADCVDDEPSVVWSQIPAADVPGVVEDKLTAILASELGMPPSAVDKNRPFPELGLNSMAAMTVLREAKQLTGAEMSPTMLWDHPTIAALSTLVIELVAQEHDLSRPPASEPTGAVDEVSVGAVSNRPAADGGAR